ncbi:TetR/AcrR family transcriptional regulator [Actinomadura harenae]|uniref:TetR/AcrR family transcriptional regulator n=1 Tax=Actinomadura harenae TaxID=2483351 RepID=A0A3M2M3X1_9ACTN|nr:TetR/AcrR family transcriptional regulator [Actinomadura harenae]RMI44122.1 TetR/AcrR family transcriptional regulator [Actinomadura harenae]
MSTTPVTGGRRGRPGYDRARLLDVAVAAFNERGYDGTGMEELSRRLGITKSAIYHHVSGKEELLDLAVNRALDALFAVLDAELDRPPGASGGTAIIDPPVTATERLERTVRGAVRVLVDEQPYVTLLLRVRGNSEVERRALERRREFDHRLAGLVARAAAEGGVRDDVDPGFAARVLFGAVNSLTEWYRPDGGMTAEAVADGLAALLFDGLRSPSRPEPAP